MVFEKKTKTAPSMKSNKTLKNANNTSKEIVFDQRILFSATHPRPVCGKG
jgi:hypothetical protein